MNMRNKSIIISGIRLNWNDNAKCKH